MAKQLKQRILLIEDDAGLRTALKMNLKEQDYKVLTAEDGHSGLKKALTKAPDLILLDLMLPGMDGLILLRSLRRKSDVPVLILTARSAELDKIVGLESGADDYLTKPFSMGELLARIQALLRRTVVNGIHETLAAGGIVLDLVSRRASIHGEPLHLSPKEFNLLAELMRHERAVLSRDLLLTRVWGHDYVGDQRTVDVHIRWLREKIEKDPSKPEIIQTVRGIGYRFEAVEPLTDEENGDEDDD